MVQIVMPGGGVTTIDEHEVLSFPEASGIPRPVQPIGMDPGSVDPYLVIVKQDEQAGT